MRVRSKKIIAILSVFFIVFSIGIPAGGIETEANAGNIERLIPGGMAFGVKFFTEGAIVLGTTGIDTAEGIVSPAKDAGLKSGDIIIRAGGTEFEDAEELIALIAGSGGKPIAIAYLRNGEENTVKVSPKRDIGSGEFKIGILVRDSTAGIGTVTYIDPETMDFGGLGHGIYDSETGLLLPLRRGAVVDVSITDVVKSYRNSPGELKGEFDTVAKGELWDNTEQGVFGRFEILPDSAGEAMPVAAKDDVHEGNAYILTTLSGSDVAKYDIEIEEIYGGSGSTKNFLVKVTDSELLDKTGGIVQGMSGSPIIQDGKIVGAVTHVLVNDPSRGYGIYIENMLDEAFDVDIQQSYSPLAA